MVGNKTQQTSKSENPNVQQQQLQPCDPMLQAAAFTATPPRISWTDPNGLGGRKEQVTVQQFSFCRSHDYKWKIQPKRMKQGEFTSNWPSSKGMTEDSITISHM